jgi:hypothetical protein
LVSHHEQASKANRQQQHRVLWPAYNPNLAPLQASTEGLFQQTQAISLFDGVLRNRDVSPVCTFAHKNYG